MALPARSNRFEHGMIATTFAKAEWRRVDWVVNVASPLLRPPDFWSITDG